MLTPPIADLHVVVSRLKLTIVEMNRNVKWQYFLHLNIDLVYHFHCRKNFKADVTDSYTYRKLLESQWSSIINKGYNYDRTYAYIVFVSELSFFSFTKISKSLETGAFWFLINRQLTDVQKMSNIINRLKHENCSKIWIIRKFSLRSTWFRYHNE